MTSCCTYIGPAVWKMDGWMIQLQMPFPGDMQEFIQNDHHHSKL